MDKVLLLDDSASGTTAKMAGLVTEGTAGIPGIELRLRKVEDATPEDVLWSDGLTAVGRRFDRLARPDCPRSRYGAAG